MGIIKTIIAIFIVAFIISAAMIWFPDETKEILNQVYHLGIMLGQLLIDLFKKFVSFIVDWLSSTK